MGTPKALLELDGRTFVERAIEALLLGGCDPVLAVVGVGGGAAAATQLARAAGAEVIVNPIEGSEQIDSLRLALSKLPQGVLGAAVMPVDVPRVSNELVAELLDAFLREGVPLALPRDGSGHGHPVVFARELFPELLRPDLPEGARTVVHAHIGEAVEVRVNDPQMLADVDTPDDFRRLTAGGG